MLNTAGLQERKSNLVHMMLVQKAITWFSVSSLNNYQFSFNLDLLTRVFGESLNMEGFSLRVIQGKACDHAIHITHAMPSGDL